MTSSYFCKLYITCLSPVLHISNQNAIWKVLLESNFQNEHSLNGKLTTQQTSSLVLCPEKLKSNAGKSARTLCCCMLKKAKINKYCVCLLPLQIVDMESVVLLDQWKQMTAACWLAGKTSHSQWSPKYTCSTPSPPSTTISIALKPPFQYINHCNLG